LTQTLFCWWTCCTTWGTRQTCQGTHSWCTPNESMSKSQASRRTSLFENWFVQSATTIFYPRLCANFKFFSTSFEPIPLRHQAASTAIKRCSITGQVVVWHCDRILLYFLTVCMNLLCLDPLDSMARAKNASNRIIGTMSLLLIFTCTSSINIKDRHNGIVQESQRWDRRLDCSHSI
jgi:hypothetical protein